MIAPAEIADGLNVRKERETGRHRNREKKRDPEKIEFVLSN